MIDKLISLRRQNQGQQLSIVMLCLLLLLVLLLILLLVLLLLVVSSKERSRISSRTARNRADEYVLAEVLSFDVVGVISRTVSVLVQ